MLNNLQNQVLDHWEAQGIVYFDTQDIGIDRSRYETLIKSEFREILDNKEDCINELGGELKIETYDIYLAYLRMKNIKPAQWIKDWAKELLRERENDNN